MTLVCGIDVGHGGPKDHGVYIPSKCDSREADLNLEVALEMKRQAGKYGIPLIINRETDIALTPKMRKDSLAHVDFVLHLHHNGAPIGASLERFQGALFLFRPGEVPSMRAAYKMATYMPSEIKRPNAVYSADPKWRNATRVLSWTNKPAILVEVCYITNPADRAYRINNPTAVHDIAEALLAGITAFADHLEEFNDVKHIP